MLSRLYRLKKRSDFSRLLENGKTKTTKFLSIKFIDNNQEMSRFGFLAGKKVFKKASFRNKIKRRLREALKENLSLVEPGKDIVFFARTGFEDRSARETSEEMLYLLKTANLIKKQ
jgi:ribonuclease P protein component